MTEYGPWTGLGLADGTAVTGANANTTGNYDNGGTITPNFAGVAGTDYSITTQRLGTRRGPGVTITGTSPTGVARLDLIHAASLPLQAVHMTFTPSAFPVGTDGQVIASSRNTATAPTFNGYIYFQSADGKLAFRATAGTNLASTNTVNGSVTPALTPALVVTHTYEIDWALVLNAAPTVSNGRVIARVRDLTDPTWNGGNEWFFDSGYSVNIGVDTMDRFRVGKTSPALSLPSAQFGEIRWRDGATAANTGLTKANAIQNFVTTTGPTVTTTRTGTRYLVQAVPATAGSYTYSVTQTVGTTNALSALTDASGATIPGYWTVTQSLTETYEYDIAITDTATTGVTTQHIVIPVSSTPSGQFRRRRWSSVDSQWH